LADLLPKLAVAMPAPGAQLDPAALFEPRPREVWLEIGFGAGEHLAWQGERHPDVGFIGAEVFVNGIASLIGHAVRRKIGNLRIHPDDARPLLEALPACSIGRVFLLFPDPWPKARHAGRRFVSPETLGQFARILADGGELRIASDDPGYVAWTLEHLARSPDFDWLAERPADWRERAEDWPATRYEQKAVKAGRRPVYLRFRRRKR
jgi:tRNA (guanine-N7-)-methyltransferase